MKNYAIILKPEVEIIRKVENFRLEKIGQKLVDGLPAHVTLKRRFVLRDKEEEDIANILNQFEMPAIEINLDKIEKFENAVVLAVEDDKLLKEFHKKLNIVIAQYIDTIKPENEGDNFKAHLTLYRSDNDVNENFLLGNVKLERMCFYEIDATPNRSFARLILEKRLK